MLAIDHSFKSLLDSMLLHKSSSESNKTSILKAKLDAMTTPILAKVIFAQLSDQRSTNIKIPVLDFESSKHESQSTISFKPTWNFITN